MLVPPEVGIETVNFCNARCPFCPLFAGPEMLDREIRPAATMTMSLFRKIVGELASWGDKPAVIYLNMDGEPLMDRYFLDRLELLASHSLAGRTIIQTNGQFMSEDKALGIVRSGVGRVAFALDGATKGTYEASRVRCNFELVLGNLRRLARLRDEAGSPTRINIKYVRTTENAHEVRDCYDLVAAFLGPADSFHDTLSVDWASPGLAGAGITYYNMTTATSVRRKPDGCRSLDNVLVVHADGRVPACCWDYNFFVRDGADFGNAHEENLLTIWNGVRFNELRFQLRKPSPGPTPRKCEGCINLFDYDIEAPPPALEGAGLNRGYGYVYSFSGRP